MDDTNKNLDNPAQPDRNSGGMRDSVPTFYLYGEPRRSVDEHFVHVEALVDRTQPSEWTIRPHTHAELNHVFHVSAGGGAMRADTARIAFTAPCLLLVPAGTVHGFHWDLASNGSVLTLASTYLTEFVCRDPDLGAIFQAAAAVPLGGTRDEAVAATFRVLRKELAWAAPGHRAAAEAGLLGLLATILRLHSPGVAAPRPTPTAALVARFRERVEERFRLREPLEAYATALGVSQRRLRAACATVARQAPADMLDQRAMLEAKRSLLYGNLSVAQIGYTLGFGDPAYFSRFFMRHAGVAPSAFRRGLRATGGD